MDDGAVRDFVLGTHLSAAIHVATPNPATTPCRAHVVEDECGDIEEGIATAHGQRLAGIHLATDLAVARLSIGEQVNK